jgi:putative photosynthetic complex assembly protein
MSTHSHDIRVPRGPLLGVALMLGITLLAVATIRWTGIEITTRSQAPVVAERHLRFEDAPDGSIRVLEVQGGAAGPAMVLQVIDAGSGGFLRGALRALVRERRLAGLGPETPFRLVARSDGRLTLEDPATTQRVDLESFGPSNSAMFARILANPPTGPRQVAATR